LTTLIVTGTFAPVRVSPQDVPVAPVLGPDDEHAASPESRKTPTASASQHRTGRFILNNRTSPAASVPE
jgi:hypothetical protein